MLVYYLLAGVLLFLMLILLMRKYTRVFSGKLYHYVYSSFRLCYYGSLKPLKYLYFFYFPTNANLRNELSNETFSFELKKGTETKKAKHLSSLRAIRFKNVQASILHGPASTFSIVLSYIALIVTIVFYYFDKKSDVINDFHFWTVIVITFFMLLLPIPLYLRYYILNLPIEEYASFVKSNLTESEMLCLTSYKIYEICDQFEKRTAWLEKANCLVDRNESDQFYLQGELDNVKHSLKYKVSKINNNLNEIKKLKNTLQFVERDLQRVSILIVYFAERLKISEVELCEHIFQFSPTMYKSWSKKFYSNLNIAISFKKMFPDDDTVNYISDELENPFYNRIRSLLYENKRFLNRNRSFKRYQCQNIAFRDFHTRIIGFTTQNSSCEAVKLYVKSLRDLFYDLERTNYSRTCFLEKLKYIFFKRKAHVGLDLHYSAQRLLEDMIERNAIKPKQNSKIKLLDYFKLEYFEQTLKIDDFKKQEQFYNETRELLNQFIRVYTYAIPYIEKCRENLRNVFRNTYENYILDLRDDEYLYIITFGYSKVVRDVIKYAIPDMINCKYNKNRSVEKIKIILFMSERESNIDSRLIKYTLTEEKNFNYCSILVSNPEFILPLLNSKTKLLILMGAEAFDECHRVIRTNEYKNHLGDFLYKAYDRIENKGDFKETFLRNGLKNLEKIKIVVCAESFKKNSDLTKIQNFFDDQYDKIEMYEGNYITDIVYDTFKL